ncbi:hypothetical protein [Streptomyces sp. NPDC102282]|uniref:hypothetical protein n=1 Tax=Streptomyces sp. NPDC102282 TaxID=3366154 RepID=UPI00381C3D42
MKLSRGTTRIGTILAATALTVAVASSAPAAAAGGTASCSTTGADGYSYTTNASLWGKADVVLRVTDTLADGHHVRVRYVTLTNYFSTKKWAWHSETGGKGSTLVYNTTAQDTDQGIADFGVEIARFEGDTLLNSCMRWA